MYVHCYVPTINDRFCTKFGPNFFMYLVQIMKIPEETHNSSPHAVDSNKITPSRQVTKVLSKVNAFKEKNLLIYLLKTFRTCSVSLLSIPGESVFFFLYLGTNGVVTCSEAESTC